MRVEPHPGVFRRNRKHVLQHAGRGHHGRQQHRDVFEGPCGRNGAQVCAGNAAVARISLQHVGKQRRRLHKVRHAHRAGWHGVGALQFLAMHGQLAGEQGLQQRDHGSGVGKFISSRRICRATVHAHRAEHCRGSTV
jgi:hypothetical protein